MNKRTILTTLAITLASVGINAQFVEKADIGGDDYANAVAAGVGGTHYVTGSTSASGGGGYDAFVSKLDSNGAVLWTKQYGGSNTEYGRHIIATTDGNYLLVGQTRSVTSSTDILAVKITPDGSVLWANAYGTSAADVSYRVVEGSGGYLIAGQTTAASQDVLLVYVGFDGTPIWTKTFGSASGNEQANDIFFTGDAFAIAGTTNVGRIGMEDGFFNLVDTLGNEQASFMFGGQFYDDLKAILPTEDAVYFAGLTGTFGHNDQSFIVKYSVGGGMPEYEWLKIYGGASLNQYVNAAKLLPNNPPQMLVLGHYGVGVNGSNSYLFVTDTAGAVLQTKVFGPGSATGNYTLNDVEISDHALLVGNADIFNNANDMIAVSAANGEFSCLSADSAFLATPQTFTALGPDSLVGVFSLDTISITTTATGFMALAQAATDSSVCTGVAASPVATTDTAVSITSVSAQVEGTASANGTPYAYLRFQYGTTPALGSYAVASTDTIHGTSSVAVSATLSSLQPNTVYYYRLEASNDVSLVAGAIKTFTTDTASTLGINENSLAIAFKVYPNPATDYLTVNYSLGQADDISYSILSIQGARIRQYSKATAVGSVTENINIGSLASGVYMLQLSSSYGSSVQRFTVVK